MIPTEWRECTWKIRPLVVLTWLVVSPAVVLPLLWIWSSDNIDWPAWVQAVGSVLAILVAVSVPWHQRKAEVAERRAQELDRERLLALRLHRNAIDACNFAIQTQRGVQAGALPSGHETALFERYLDSVIACFEQETDEARAEIASYIRGVLIILIYDLQAPRVGEEYLCALNTAVGNLRKYKDQAKSALTLIPELVVE